MSKLTLNNVSNLLDTTTAQTTINSNNVNTVTALENTLSRDGTAPNAMQSTLDMNSNQIINLPGPATGTSPLRLQDLSSFTSGGTVTNIPPGGTAGQVLGKSSNADYNVTWEDAISTVANSDGSLTVNTTAGSVTASVNPAHANTWSGQQTFVAPVLGTPASGVMTNVTGLPVSTGVSGLGTGVATFLATPTSVNLASALTDETGTGANVFANSPTLVTPVLGTPASGVLTNTTGLPVSTGISGLGTGVATFLATPSSANLIAAITDETGTGSAVFATSPTLTTPTLGVATVTTINKVTVTAPASAATLTIPDGVTLTGPASSGTAMTLGNTETVTGAKTFGSSGAVGRFKLAGTTSGTTIVDASATASGTLTLPAATDTLVGKATTDTLTNKTFDTAGSGNSFSINSLAATANTGTGSVVRATSPTLVTPVLGTPSSGTLTSCTGLPLSGLTTQAAYTFVGNNTGSTAVPTAVDIAALTTKASPAAGDYAIISDQAASGAWKKATVSSLASAGSVSSIAGNTGAFTLANGIDNSTNQIQLTAARRTLPTSQPFITGTSATYTTPANCLWIEVFIVGAGGGGGGAGTGSQTNGGTGGTTTFNAITAIGGGGGTAGTTGTGAGANGGAGGTGGTGTTNSRIIGNAGQSSGAASVGVFSSLGGTGGGSSRGGGGLGGTLGGSGSNGNANGGGAGGASSNGGVSGGGGGGGGETAYVIINSPSATYTYSVGAGGTAGGAGTGGTAGGVGGAGYILVLEHYGT